MVSIDHWLRDVNDLVALGILHLNYIPRRPGSSDRGFDCQILARTRKLNGNPDPRARWFETIRPRAAHPLDILEPSLDIFRQLPHPKSDESVAGPIGKARASVSVREIGLGGPVTALFSHRVPDLVHGCSTA
ncbi:MAG: hypothetical protein OXG77_00220 [Chloroflexi bacterium]|nr:hypothetical protein [Chloroflexota bacterium]